MEPPLIIQQLPDGPATSITFFDALMFRLPSAIPDGMLFAARWWLSALLLAVFAPLWFREVTGRARFGALCAVLVYFAPSNQWWSYRPSVILGFLFAGCYLAFPASRAIARRRWLLGGFLAIASGVLLARYPANYQPFAIVLGIPVLAVSVVAMVRLRTFPRAVSLLTIGIVAATSGVLLAGVIHENWSAIQATANTLYPGSRRSTGMRQAAWSFFSGPTLGPLTTTDPIAGSNASEISTGFTFTAIWAAALLLFSRTLRRRADMWILGVAGGFTVLWLSWISFDWGDFGLHIPVMNLVQPSRAGMAMIGILSSITLCLVLSYWDATPRANAAAIAVGCAFACGAATIWGGRSLQSTLYPSLPTHWIVLAAIGVGSVVVAITVAPNRLWPLALAAGLALLVTGRVNPIIFGLGDLRDSPTAQAMLEYGGTSRQTGALWASDSVYTDALFMATAVPSISSRQQAGPVAAEWRRLDPTGAHEDVWNRAGTFVNLQWAPDGEPLTLGNAAADFITIRVSPCEINRRFPDVRRIASSQPLTNACLRPIQRLTWVGAPMWLYAIRGT